MNWYYVDQGQQAGPVTDAQLEELVRSGKIQPNTLIWREGMANWQAYREVHAPTPVSAPPPPLAPSHPVGQGPEAVCAECGNLFPLREVIRHGEVYICAKCKPVFMQKLSEGARFNPHSMRYAGFWIRLVAKIVDGLVLTILLILPLVVLIFVLVAVAARSSSHTSLHLDFVPHAAADDVAGLAANFVGLFIQCGFIIAQVLYSTFFLGKYGATPGKMMCGLKVVDADNNPITYGRALGRGCAELLSGMICDIGYIIAAFDNPQKRALHDHICNTRVVYK